MRNRMGGAAMITAATFLAFYAMPTQKEEMVQEVNPHVIENQVSNLLTGDTSVPTNQVPITLVDVIDGDTIKVRVNGKIESVRYLLVDLKQESGG